MNKLYIKQTAIVKNKSLLEFLENYLNANSPATFDSQKCSDDEINCLDNKRRSISDLLDIYNTYNNSDHNYNDIIKYLPKINLINNKIITLRYCGTPSKVVVFKRGKPIFTQYKINGKFMNILDGLYDERDKIGLDGISISYIIKLLEQEYDVINNF